MSGPVVVVLANSSSLATSPIIGSQVVSASKIVWYTSGLNYMNIHSTTYAGGEVRGDHLSKW